MTWKVQADHKIADVIATHPETRAVFEAHGLGALVSEDGLRALGPFLTLGTALRSRSLDVGGFLSLLAEAAQADPLAEAPGLGEIEEQGELALLALMPCGLRVPFGRDVAAFMEALRRERGMDVRYAVEGNLNQELSYYSYVPMIDKAEDLPDIILSSDFNTFYGRDFRERFVDTGQFTGCGGIAPSASYTRAGIPDPEGQYTVLGINPLVMVVNTAQLRGRPAPTDWADLLDPCWRGEITLRGGPDFFCHAVQLPVWLRHGAAGLRALADNVRQGMHPSQMVKAIDANAPGAIYVMPEFFAQRAKHKERLQIVWPDDGALASPVTLQVKASRVEALQPVLDYLTGESLARTMAGARFPVRHAQIESEVQDRPLFWLGWEFLRGQDLLQVNEEIDAVFLDRALAAMARAAGS